MNTEDKIRELQKRLRKGEPEGEIREELKREGYTQDQVNKLFPPRSYDMRSWYLISAFVFLLGGIYLFLRNENNIWLLIGSIGSAILFYCYYRERKKINPDS